jgi:hypothetical protein
MSNDDSNENDPSVPVRFLFSPEKASDSEKDLTLRYEALDHRISTIDQKCAITSPDGHGQMTIISQILSMTTDQEELSRLSLGIGRAAELAQEREDLKNKLDIIKAVKTKPDWMASVFGDFSNDLDKFLQSDGMFGE